MIEVQNGTLCRAAEAQGLHTTLVQGHKAQKFNMSNSS